MQIETSIEKLVAKIAYEDGYKKAKLVEVQTAMEKRCEEEQHNYENCCSILFQVYQQCKWCGHRR